MVPRILLVAFLGGLAAVAFALPAKLWQPLPLPIAAPVAVAAGGSV